MIATLANAAWAASASPAYAAFRAALREPEDAQRRWLADHLHCNADAAFARQHDLLRTTSLEEYRARVPIRPYDELVPWIDRIRRGERQVLTAEPVERLMTSSGSTAAVKLLPQTRTLRREFDAAIGPWIVDLFRRHPGAMRGRAYWSITPNTPPPRLDSAVPIGFEADDAAYLGGLRSWLVGRVMAVPPEVASIPDGDALWRATLDCLVRRRDLSLISVWHPSFLSMLLDRLDGRDPRDAWPRLRLVSAWADAAAAGPFRQLRDRLPQVDFQPKGLLATEGCITIPFAGFHLPALTSHLLEFEDDESGLHLAHELRDDGEYAVVLTTGGGLWRYRLGDRVRVVGRLGSVPSLRLVGRADAVVDRFGEKLCETFVASIITRVAPEAGFAMLAPDGERYTLFLDRHPANGSAATLDAGLRDNPHYDHCRNLGQLHHADVAFVSRDVFARYTRRLTDLGMRLGDVKPTSLSGLADWRAALCDE
jgi:hypothetical protein